LILSFGLTVLGGGLWTAQAQESPCDGKFALEEWREAMDAVDRAVSVGNVDLSKKILDQIQDALTCSEALVRPPDLGRFARQMSVTAFYRQEDDDATQWAQLSLEADPNAAWPDTLPQPDAYDELLASISGSQRVGPSDQGLAVPKRGGVIIDGRLALRPEVSPAIPHLVQVADSKGQPLGARWMDGAAFPADLLGQPVEVSIPKWYVDPDARETAGEPAPVVGVAPLPVLDTDAQAQCPWKAIKQATVDASTVTINKTVYPVRSPHAQAGFLDILYVCEEFEAAGRFQKWRAARAINPFEGSMDRDAMMRALND
jgi:hypothetical protein